MSANDPKTYEKYLERFGYNNKVTGFGADVTTHMPCPWCASPDFMVVTVIDAIADLERGHTCRVCGRSGRTIITQDAGGTSAEFVQTGGEVAPPWLEPAPRRVEGEGE